VSKALAAVFLFAETVPLNHRAHRAVQQQNPGLQSVGQNLRRIWAQSGCFGHGHPHIEQMCSETQSYGRTTTPFGATADEQPDWVSPPYPSTWTTGRLAMPSTDAPADQVQEIPQLPSATG